MSNLYIFSWLLDPESSRKFLRENESTKEENKQQEIPERKKGTIWKIVNLVRKIEKSRVEH